MNIGQFALADDFYLIGLDDRTGRPRKGTVEVFVALETPRDAELLARHAPLQSGDRERLLLEKDERRSCAVEHARERGSVDVPQRPTR